MKWHKKCMFDYASTNVNPPQKFSFSPDSTLLATHHHSHRIQVFNLSSTITSATDNPPKPFTISLPSSGEYYDTVVSADFRIIRGELFLYVIAKQGVYYIYRIVHSDQGLRLNLVSDSEILDIC